jgi:transposase-like protein
MLGHVAKAQQPIIAAAIRGIFQAASLAEAHQRLVEVVDRLQPVAPKVARLLEAAEAELLAFYQLPREHWSKLRSTNPLERVNREIGRRTDVVGIFPNDAALLRLAGALLIEQNAALRVSGFDQEYPRRGGRSWRKPSEPRAKFSGLVWNLTACLRLDDGPTAAA